jgi:hypothetical protein
MNANIHFKSFDANQLITDMAMMSEIINLYYEGKFPEMKGLIMEYGEQQFFTELYQWLAGQTWRNYKNKHLIFVGIVIQFFKIYT